MPADKKKRDSDLYDIAAKFIDRAVKIIGIIPYSIARLLESFVSHDKAGVKILGGALMVMGILMSSDGMFQAFGGKPLFPWWEPTWIGVGWLWVWLKVNFWAAVTVSLGIIWVESWTIRGKSPDHAKASYDEIAHHSVPEKKANGIDLIEARRMTYKRAGMGERSVLGAFIILMFALDIGATFNARNPMGHPPTEFLAILIYNILTIVSGEVGYALWRKSLKEG